MIGELKTIFSAGIITGIIHLCHSLCSNYGYRRDNPVYLLPRPYGEYDELFSERLLVWRPDAAEMADMNEGDCHIGWSLIVGAGGPPGGFSYDEIDADPSTPLPGDGDVLIKGFVGIGTTGPKLCAH